MISWRVQETPNSAHRPLDLKLAVEPLEEKTIDVLRVSDALRADARRRSAPAGAPAR